MNGIDGHVGKMVKSALTPTVKGTNPIGCMIHAGFHIPDIHEVEG